MTGRWGRNGHGFSWISPTLEFGVILWRDRNQWGFGRFYRRLGTIETQIGPLDLFRFQKVPR